MDMRMFQNKPVSLLGYGCMRFPTQEKDGKRTILRAEAEKLLDCAYAGGVNYYDTAYGYHGGEMPYLSTTSPRRSAHGYGPSSVRLRAPWPIA